MRAVGLHPDEGPAATEDAQALGDVPVEVEEVLEVRVADHGVEVLVGKREAHRVEVHVVRLDAARRGAPRPGVRHVGADDAGPAVLQQLGEEAGAAAGLEHQGAGLDALDDHREPVPVDVALRQLGPVLIVVVDQVHRSLLSPGGRACVPADGAIRREGRRSRTAGARP